mgnify:CR=1 FL=1
MEKKKKYIYNVFRFFRLNINFPEEMPPKKGKKKEKKKAAAGKDDGKEEKDPRDNPYELDLHDQ